MALSDKHTECAQCGMVCAPNEYHPYAACLMFMACKDGPYVRAKLAEVRKSDEALIRQLTDLVQAQHDYIMALPADVVASIPAMPGFDGDPTDEEMRLIRIGWDAAHGVKGGQHVS